MIHFGTFATASQATVSFQIVLGIVTGILTTAVLWGARAIWEHRVRPRIEQMLYNGLQVDGPWYAQIVGKEDAVRFTLAVQQTGGKLSGTGRIRLINSSNDFDTSGSLSGELWEGYIAFSFRPINRRSTAFMSGLFKVTEAGAVLHGYLSIRDKTAEKVVTVEIALHQGHPPPDEAVAFESALISIAKAKISNGENR